MNILFYILAFLILFDLHKGNYIKHIILALIIINIIVELNHDDIINFIRNRLFNPKKQDNKLPIKIESKVESGSDSESEIVKLTAKNITNLITKKYTEK